MRKLTNLQVLRLGASPLQSMLGVRGSDMNSFFDLFSIFSRICEYAWHLLEAETSVCLPLMELTCSGPLDALKVLILDNCRSLTKFPDLSNLSHLEELLMIGCERLAELTCTGSVSALKHALFFGCRSLKAIPDLRNFPNLGELRLSGCGSLMS